MSLYYYDATVLRVVDGDTIDLSCDLGFRVGKRDRFRLYGINAPERGQTGWAEANAALQAMLPVGERVTIRTYHPTTRDPADKYGRWLATVLTGDGLDVNQAMVDQGHAVEYMR